MKIPEFYVFQPKVQRIGKITVESFGMALGLLLKTKKSIKQKRLKEMIFEALTFLRTLD